MILIVLFIHLYYRRVFINYFKNKAFIKIIAINFQTYNILFLSISQMPQIYIIHEWQFGFVDKINELNRNDTFETQLYRLCSVIFTRIALRNLQSRNRVMYGEGHKRHKRGRLGGKQWENSSLFLEDSCFQDYILLDYYTLCTKEY